jgi:hypothetical protein
MLSYEDGPKALVWLASAFGFIERARIVDAAGRLTHGEMEVDGGGLIMLATPSADYESPKRHRNLREHAQVVCRALGSRRRAGLCGRNRCALQQSEGSWCDYALGNRKWLPGPAISSRGPGGTSVDVHAERVDRTPVRTASRTVLWRLRARTHAPQSVRSVA